MRVRRWLLIALTAAFSAASLWALSERSYTGLLQFAFQGAAEVQLFTDLTVAAVLASTWMVRAARRRGIASWPFLVLVVAAGSFGLLAYLWRLEFLRLCCFGHQQHLFWQQQQ